MKCTNCGNEVPNTAKVCGHCGHRLKAAAPGREPKTTKEPVSTPGAVAGWRWGTIARVGAIFCVVLLAGAGYWLLKFRVPAANEPPIPSFAPTLPLTTALPPTSVPSTQQTNCNAAQFISDLDVPDGTIMTPGQTFTKSWRIKNIGTCTWTADYRIVFSSGDQMTGAGNQALPGNVMPGQEVDLSVSLIAPDAEGNYIGGYALQDANGGVFFSLTVNINVQAAATPENWVVVFNEDYNIYDEVVNGRVRLYWSSPDDWDRGTWAEFPPARDIRISFDYFWVEGAQNASPKLVVIIDDTDQNNTSPLSISYDLFVDGWRLGLNDSDTNYWPSNSYSYGDKVMFTDSLNQYGNHVQIVRRDHVITLEINGEVVNTYEYTSIDSSPETRLMLLLDPADRWYYKWILDIDNLMVEELR